MGLSPELWGVLHQLRVGGLRNELNCWMPAGIQELVVGVENPPHNWKKWNVLDVRREGSLGPGRKTGEIPWPQRQVLDPALTPSCHRLCCTMGLCIWPVHSPARPRRNCPVCCRLQLWGDKAGWSESCLGGAVWGSPRFPDVYGRLVKGALMWASVYWAPVMGAAGRVLPPFTRGKPRLNEA